MDTSPPDSRMELPEDFNPESIIIDPDSNYMDPIEALFVEKRRELAYQFCQHALDVRKNSYTGSQTGYEIAELLEQDKINLLSILLSHDEVGATGWVMRLECCGPFRINIIFEEINRVQEKLRAGTSGTVDKALSLIGAQIGRLRIQTFMIDFEADRFDEQARILDEQFEMTFAPSGFLDPLFEMKILWDTMNVPFKDCTCHRCQN